MTTDVAPEYLLLRLPEKPARSKAPGGKRSRLFLGRNVLQASLEPVLGQHLTLSGEGYYRIANYDRMRPFFMSIVSSSDHWMFISSTGALTAGRRSPDLALFPYQTEDKIHDSAETTGSKTVMIVERDGDAHLWEPFSDRHAGIYRLHRSLTKSFCGTKLIFEEFCEDLGLAFRYGWFTSHRFGFVRRAWLTNSGAAPVHVRMLDGIQNLMPCGIGSQFQTEKSNLVDAYKINELVSRTGLGLYRLSSIPIDRPEPAEAFRTTAAWSVGLDRVASLLSSTQLNRFRMGLPVTQETDVRGERGAYFVEGQLTLHRGQTSDWLIVADVDRGPSEVAWLNRALRSPDRLRTSVVEDVDRGSRELEEIVARADGLQKTAEPVSDARRFSNALFNVMRGGVFSNGYMVDAGDLAGFLQAANRPLASRRAAFLRGLRGQVRCDDLVERAVKSGDRNLERLCREYLPLTFSRRHGDPSRPWNRFTIPARGADGTRAVSYEGNWRDIFQNWEALAVSFPGYIAGMVCRFVNASTADGYNPYRITRDGIDWEVPDPQDPWSHIGYWGDHQIIYMLKLLEALRRHDPAQLRALLAHEVFCYANVPYRIKSYAELLKNPKETVTFDCDMQELVRRRTGNTGFDGKLVWDRSGQVRLVNLAEKLLVPLLAKLSNFIPGAGIWMNTQRPEWNDANNALVGNGVSMVTLCYLRRYLAFCLELLQPLEDADIRLSVEVARFLKAACRILDRYRHLLPAKFEGPDRKRFLDEMGRAGSRYRQQIYTRGFSGEVSQIGGSLIARFFRIAMVYVDKTIGANRRPDGLYHAYNLVRFDSAESLSIRRLYEMLEGQVAVLSSGRLTPEESLGVLQALKRSAMYRADQHSYLLYPDRRLPRFAERNNLSRKDVARSELLKKLLSVNDGTLVERDVNGRVHFNGMITNARDVGRILAELAGKGHARLVRKESSLVLGLYERLVDHQSFTGRSCTFFGYEGLGCIYWHMVSKLLLAVQETFHRAVDAAAPAHILRQLAECYFDIREGIGDRKTPEVYGGFPMDPYSHTPGGSGARQPGLTGQVKEDILCRMGELGLFVKEGRISFRPLLLRPGEFLTASADFRYHDVAGVRRRIRLAARSLAFTCCQVPIVYALADSASTSVFRANGTSRHQSGASLDERTSVSILRREGRVGRVEVRIKPPLWLDARATGC